MSQQQGLPMRRPIRLRPEHVLPLALHFAEQDASGETGQVTRALEWSEQHGHGGLEAWAYAPDLEAAREAV
jgi:hypothetical protein